MRKHRLQRGLYLITPDARDPSRLLERVLPLLPFAACLQLRAKSMDDSLLRDAGARLREACADARVPFIVNDDARLAQELDADGVHLGEHDGGIAGARALLGENAIIGVSCYDDLERARTLTAQGADYLAFGAFFPSPTKPHARRASLDLLRDSAVFGLPRVQSRRPAGHTRTRWWCRRRSGDKGRQPPAYPGRYGSHAPCSRPAALLRSARQTDR